MMSRKALTLLCMPLLLVVLLGCPKKAPEPVPEPPPPAPAPPPPAPPPPPPPPDPLTSDDFAVVNKAAERQGFQANVYFDFDKSNLRSSAEEALATNAKWLSQHPEFLVRIEGHCDERGTAEYNLALGDRRANTAGDSLTAHGVAADRLTAITYGQDRPVCTESNEACWQKNRRAYMVITGRR